MTRLLVGDELGDALGLPFVPRARVRARRTLRVLRAYGRACEHWLLGRLAWPKCPNPLARSSPCAASLSSSSPPALPRAALWAREERSRGPMPRRGCGGPLVLALRRQFATIDRPGPLLVGAHRLMLRLLQAIKGEETFPMLCPALPP